MKLNRRKLIATTAAMISATWLPGASFGADPVSVVATTGMIADITSRIGADQITVRALMGPGVDPHAYRQTRSDIVNLTRADLVLWHGLYLEAQMEDFFDDMARQRPVVAVAEHLSADQLLAHDIYSDKVDPHVWMDPRLWVDVADGIGETLATQFPGNADLFAANLAALKTELKDLSAYADNVLQTVPEQSRVLVTAHDAFKYFGKAHGFEVIGIQGISTESEAGLNRISELVNMLLDRNIGAVFVESSVSDRNMRALIEGAAAKGHDVRIGGELFSDAMGEPGTYEGTYIGMIDHNVTTIAAALGGQVPKGGMQGLLKDKE